jgi:hypothetical protein
VPLAVQLDPSTLHLLAGVLAIGSCSCITGFSIGSKYFFPKADLRTAYKLAIYATPSNVAALGMLAVETADKVHWDPVLVVTSTATTLFIIAAHCWVAWDLIWEVKRINERVRTAIERVLADD